MRIYSIRGEPSDNREPESVETAKRRLAKTLANPQNWFDSAKRLRFAMRQLEPCIAQFWKALANEGTDNEKVFPVPDVECISVHLMLAGLAIENLCKGYITAHLSTEEKETIEKGNLPTRLDQNHRILKMIDETGLNSSTIEKELLKRIQDSVTWLGRYPAPKSPKNVVNEIHAATDVEQINLFLARLAAYVEDYRSGEGNCCR